jgi:hypothetical protein
MTFPDDRCDSVLAVVAHALIRSTGKREMVVSLIRHTPRL